jgi:hypothetical protein
MPIPNSIASPLTVVVRSAPNHPDAAERSHQFDYRHRRDEVAAGVSIFAAGALGDDRDSRRPGDAEDADSWSCPFIAVRLLN